MCMYNRTTLLHNRDELNTADQLSFNEKSKILKIPLQMPRGGGEAFYSLPVL